MSPMKTAEIERAVSLFLGNTCREFRSCELAEEDIMNADDTHFVVNMNYGKSLVLRGDSELNMPTYNPVRLK